MQNINTMDVTIDCVRLLITRVSPQTPSTRKLMMLRYFVDYPSDSKGYANGF